MIPRANITAWCLTSAGGTYEITGSIGQPDAGELSGERRLADPAALGLLQWAQAPARALGFHSESPPLEFLAFAYHKAIM